MKVRLDADVSGYQAAMRTAQKATVDFAKRANDAGKRGLDWVDEHRASINDLSNTALGLGAGLLAGAGLAAKAAMDWESAWTGVQKTVDGTEAEMAGLEQGLRDMAKTLPATHAEIAAVAEAAGQLGVGVNDVEDFTRVMIDMGESTNLSSEEAATSLARFMNVMGTSQDDVGKLGAAVVGLGNSFAASESEIVALAQRLSGAGAQAGLTEGDVLGLAAAMADVGIEAEAGGSAMSQTMKRIGKAVDEGGESLELFAQVSGMSADEFSQAWQSDPASAMDAFITGLSGVEEQGMTTNGVLTELGITGIRESDALLRLSAAAGTTAEAMAQGNAEFEAGTALIEEASKRYQTAESKLAILRNTLVDVGIDVGGALAPALSDAAETIGFLVEKFQGLPDAAKSALGMGAGIGGMALIAAGGLGKALTSVSDLRVAMKELGWATMDTSKKMKLLGVGSAVTLAITGLAMAVGHFVSEAAKAEANAESLVDTFDDLTGAATAATDTTILQQISEDIDAADWEKLRDLGITYEEVVEAVKGGTEGFREFNARTAELKQGLDTSTAAGREQRNALIELEQAVAEGGVTYEEAAAKHAELSRQQEAVGDTAAGTAEGQQVLEAAVEETGVALDGTIEKLSTFLDLLFETGLATMSARDAQSAFHESVEGVDAAVEQINSELGGMSAALNDNKTDFDLTTEAGRVANGAFQDIAKSGMDLTKALADNNATQDELQGSLNRTYDDLVTAAQGMGLSEQAAEDLAREVLGIPDGVSIETWMSDEAERQADETRRAVDGITRNVTVTTRFVTQGRPPRVSPNGTRTATVYADGGVREPSLMAFAGGAENHVAQIAGAGEMRLWAEPETGGEAYIPLAQSKRARSEAILADVAGRFGMALSKFDSGGMILPPSPRPAASLGSSPAAPVDYAQMGAYMREAVSGMTVALNLDGRTLYGAVVDAGRAQRRPFVTRGA